MEHYICMKYPQILLISDKYNRIIHIELKKNIKKRNNNFEILYKLSGIISFESNNYDLYLENNE